MLLLLGIEAINFSVFKNIAVAAGHQWLMPAILATQEAEIKIAV
jgi:hypothetical protein